MAYVLPTIGDFKAQFVRDFPYATPLVVPGVVQAQAVANLDSGGSVASITVTVPGSGYPATRPVYVVVYGDGGMGCEATPVVTGGAISAVMVDNPGFGFQSSGLPHVYISTGGDNTDDQKVTDFDIAGAFVTATAFNLTTGLWGSQAAFVRGYNLLTAHYLLQNLLAGGLGLHGRAEWLTKAKQVGNVSESFEVPKRILNSPFMSRLSKTTYGMQFLELVSPWIIANFQSYHRATLP